MSEAELKSLAEKIGPDERITSIYSLELVLRMNKRVSREVTVALGNTIRVLLCSKGLVQKFHKG